MLSTCDKALQVLPGIQVTKLGDGRSLFVVQHQHALDHRLLLVEQQAGLILLDALDTRVERGLGPAVGFEIFARRGLAPQEVREVGDPDEATNLVEITALGANRHPALFFPVPPEKTASR